MLVVLDTNVLVSGVLWREGVPGHLLGFVMRELLSFAMSPKL